MNVLDREQIATLTGGDDDLLADLAMTFARQFPDSRARFRVAMEDANIRDLSMVANRIRSHLAYFGSTDLCLLASRISTSAQSNQLAEVQQVADSLFAGIDRLFDDLRNVTRLSLDVSDD